MKSELIRVIDKLIREKVMVENINGEKIVLEIRDLINGVGKVKEEIDVYCELMKQMFLSSSSSN